VSTAAATGEASASLLGEDVIASPKCFTSNAPLRSPGIELLDQDQTAGAQGEANASLVMRLRTRRAILGRGW